MKVYIVMLQIFDRESYAYRTRHSISQVFYKRDDALSYIKALEESTEENIICSVQEFEVQ